MKFFNLPRIMKLEILFPFSLILNFFNYFLYEKTLIQLEVISMLFSVGILFYLMFRKSDFFTTVPRFESFIYSIIICGSFLTFTFLGLNYTLSKNQLEITTYKVKYKVPKLLNSDKQIQSPSVVNVELGKRISKRIGLSKEFKINKIHPDSLDIHLYRGLFGYSIIKKVEFRKQS